MEKIIIVNGLILVKILGICIILGLALFLFGVAVGMGIEEKNNKSEQGGNK